ncbi:MAG: hypothetical protein ACHQRM_11655 [Bacteroidia bacterium]
MRRLFAVLVLSMVVFSSNAQMVWKKGYAILNNGDSVKGDIRLNPKKESDAYFKVMVKVTEDNKKNFNATKIKEYSFDSTRFVSRQVEGEFSFVKVLASGSINLYEHLYEWQSGDQIVYKAEYFIEKGNSKEMVKVKQGKFKKFVEENMADNSSLVKDVQDKKYDFEQLTEVVQQYNNWAKTQKG